MRRQPACRGCGGVDVEVQAGLGGKLHGLEVEVEPADDRMAILAVGGGSYGVLYAVAGACALLGAVAILPVRRVR